MLDARSSHVDATVAAELQRALDEPDPLRGSPSPPPAGPQRSCANPDGLTRTKALGRECTARKLRTRCPAPRTHCATAVWDLPRPMLSPNLVRLNREALVLAEALESTVRLEEHHGNSDLSELDLGEEHASAG